MTRIILDTGPIVAFLNKRDKYFTWANEVFKLFKPPVYTCDSVISEACFLLRDMKGSSISVIELLERNLLVVDFDLSGEIQAVKKLMSKYVSELVNDRISKFTIDKLVNMAARVGLTPRNCD